MRTGSVRWWFEDRTTGRITIAQFPNWQLWAALGGSVAASLVTGGSVGARLVEWAAHGLWIYWAALELFRGVNPWRRVLGLAVILWQVSQVLW